LPLLKKYRDRYLCFNDDIQGTGAVTLSGLLSSLAAQGLSHKDLVHQTIVCLGAGSAGVGVCEAILSGMVMEGLSYEEARKKFYIMDNRGLLVAKNIDKLSEQQRPFARTDFPNETISLEELIKRAKPTILLGLSGSAGAFTKEAVTEMAKNTKRPVIFALSNPTRLSECTAQQAIEWTNGKCIFASGSPFEPVTFQGKVHHISQGNNMYIFPGLGYGATLCATTKITDEMFYSASKALSSMVSSQELAQGQVYPDITQIREVSSKIAVEVCKIALEKKLARVHPPDNVSLDQWVKDSMYVPQYYPLVNPPTATHT